MGTVLHHIHGNMSREIMLMSQPMVRLTPQFPPVSLNCSGFSSRGATRSQFDGGRSCQGRLPKLNFPVFSGEDPQLWKSRYENYFGMYSVESSLWLRVTSMHFEGAATRWW
jgi:hypothetical protein